MFKLLSVGMLVAAIALGGLSLGCESMGKGTGTVVREVKEAPQDFEKGYDEAVHKDDEGK